MKKIRGLFGSILIVGTLLAALLFASSPAAAVNYNSISVFFWPNGCAAGGTFTPGCAGVDIAATPFPTLHDPTNNWNNWDDLSFVVGGHIEDWDGGPATEDVVISVTATQLFPPPINAPAAYNGVCTWTAGPVAKWQAGMGCNFGPWTLNCANPAQCAGVGDAWTVTISISFVYNNCGGTAPCWQAPPSTNAQINGNI